MREAGPPGWRLRGNNEARAQGWEEEDARSGVLGASLDNTTGCGLRARVKMARCSWAGRVADNDTIIPAAVGMASLIGKEEGRT